MRRLIVNFFSAPAVDTARSKSNLKVRTVRILQTLKMDRKRRKNVRPVDSAPGCRDSGSNAVTY